MVNPNWQKQGKTRGSVRAFKLVALIVSFVCVCRLHQGQRLLKPAHKGRTHDRHPQNGSLILNFSLAIRSRPHMTGSRRVLQSILRVL